MKNEERATELEFLEYYYMESDFGPSHSDVVYMIKQNFIKDKGKLLPVGYDFEEDEDD